MVLRRAFLLFCVSSSLLACASVEELDLCELAKDHAASCLGIAPALDESPLVCEGDAQREAEIILAKECDEIQAAGKADAFTCTWVGTWLGLCDSPEPVFLPSADYCVGNFESAPYSRTTALRIDCGSDGVFYEQRVRSAQGNLAAAQERMETLGFELRSYEFSFAPSFVFERSSLATDELCVVHEEELVSDTAAGRSEFSTQLHCGDGMISFQREVDFVDYMTQQGLSVLGEFPEVLDAGRRKIRKQVVGR